MRLMNPLLALGVCVLGLVAGPARADKISNPTAVLDGLDKITGRIITFEVGINETVQFGTLQVTPRVCYSRPPTDPPRTDGFVQVDEIDENKHEKRIFSGWMFADSPGLNAVEHPIYDVWLIGCKGGTTVIHEAPQRPRRPMQVRPTRPPVRVRSPPRRRRLRSRTRGAPSPRLRPSSRRLCSRLSLRATPRST